MAKLPGIAELGPAAAADSARPVGTYDATPIARGAAAIAQGAERLGAGVAKFGEGVADVASNESRWQYSKAVSDFTSRKIDLDAAIGQDSNYGPDKGGKTLPQRYEEQLNSHRANAANMIADPGMRGLFMQHTQPQFAQGKVQAANHARALSNDAQTAYVSQMGDKAINQAIAAKDDATRTQLIDAHNQLIDGLNDSGAISDVQAVQMKRDWAHQYATADTLARAETDPQGVINELRAQPGSAGAITNRIISIEGEGRNGKSSAVGVGQFTDGTWLDVLKRNRPDLANGRSDQDLLLMRADKRLARDMVGKLQEENAGSLKNAGLPATPGNIYLAHFLGPGGAAAVLKAPPNMPVADVLAKAVGPEKARAMIEANPTVLQGQLAGSVKAWADGKMGGASPGGGGIHDMLRPDVREQLLAHAQTQLQKQNVQDLTGFKQRLEDNQAEASRTGNVTKPLGLSDFIGQLGADLGPKAYQTYQANIQVARDVTRVSTMDQDQMRQLVDSYAPKPGEGFAAQAERQDLVRQAVAKSLKERSDDPAGFAVTRLPGTQEAYKGYSEVAANPTASPGERAVAARSFASTTLLEQQGAGVPAAQRQIMPASDVERFKTTMTNAATSDDPKARAQLIGQIHAQRAMWGDYWPQVMRQLAPSMQPMVRAIAADADPVAMTRLLSLDPKENPAAILKEQSETKSSDVRKALNTEMAPLLATMVGAQKDRDFFDYYNLADRLAALYVRDGMDGPTAARKAFTDLIGKNYDFRDTYRIPKDPHVSPDDVQAGALVARSMIGIAGSPGAPGGTFAGQLEPGNIDVNNRPTVHHPDGKISTVRSMSANFNGKEVLLPTVSDAGKLLSDDEAIAEYRKTGKHLGVFDTPDNADRYAKALHDAQEQRYGGIQVRPAIDDVGGLSDARADSLSKFKRDGVWVTSPDNSGLNLAYGDKFVRGADGAPLHLPWAQLAKMGGSPEARAEAIRRGTEFGIQAP